MPSGFASTMRWRPSHARAALGAQPFEQPPGPGEIAIPAIRGVGGGVLYFVDKSKRLEHIWEDEFVLAQDADQAAGGDAGLASFDHVAQTMNYAEMLTWILFYTSIFDTGKSPMVDIVDPSGLVRSQVIENASGALRLTLNGAENRNTLAGHFMAETFGSNVQHLAFASRRHLRLVGCDAQRWLQASCDLAELFRRHRGALCAVLPILSTKLKAGDILYDRDAGGEYFQFYSQNYGEGFFFEIVERRGDYKGYGAPNAPVPHRRAEARDQALGDVSGIPNVCPFDGHSPRHRRADPASLLERRPGSLGPRRAERRRSRR